MDGTGLNSCYTVSPSCSIRGNRKCTQPNNGIEKGFFTLEKRDEQFSISLACQEKKLFSYSHYCLFMSILFPVCFLREKVLECPIYSDSFYSLGVRRNKTYSKPRRIIAKHFNQAKGLFLNEDCINDVKKKIFVCKYERFRQF